MNSDEVLFINIAKIANTKRPVIAVPSRIAKELDLEDIYVKFVLRKDRTLILEQCNSSGEPIIEELSEFHKKVLESQTEIINQVKENHEEAKNQIIESKTDIKNEQIETRNDIKNKLDKNQMDIKNSLFESNRIIEEKLTEFNQTLSKIKTTQPQVPPAIFSPSNDFEPQKDNLLAKDENKEIELINIKEKDPSDYKYIFRYTEQDLTYEPQLVGILVGDEKVDLDRDEVVSRYGFNLTALYGEAAIKLDSKCDWECDYKGKDRVPIHTYFNPRLETFILNEDGEEERVPYEKVEPFEYKALYEFVSITGTKYRLDNDEMWFDTYHFDADGRTIEELLSKRLYKEYLKGKYTKRLTFTKEK